MHKENSPLYNLGSLRDDLDSSHVISRAPSLVPPLIKTQVPPLHDISNAQQVPKHSDGVVQVKWKRLPRTVVGSPSISTDIVGSKRPMDMASNLSALPSKKILVSHLDKGNQFVLAAAGSQPRQEQ